MRERKEGEKDELLQQQQKEHSLRVTNISRVSSHIMVAVLRNGVGGRGDTVGLGRSWSRRRIGSPSSGCSDVYADGSIPP